METSNPYVNMEPIEQYECDVQKMLPFTIDGFVLEDNVCLLNINFFETCVVARILSIGTETKLHH
jgi:hypothetical protein